MKPAPATRSGLGALVLASLFLAALVTAVVWQWGPGGAAAAGNGPLVGEPYVGSPANVFLGASPQEAPGEVWATAKSKTGLARFTESGGWETVTPVDATGAPVAGVSISGGAGVGRTTPRGGVAVTAQVGETGPSILVRDPGGLLRDAPEPPEAVLPEGEALFVGEEAKPLLAAMEAGETATRALIVPVDEATGPTAVLAEVDGVWSREQICAGIEAGPLCAPPAQGFKVLGIDAAGGEAWLLAEGGEAEGEEPGEGEEGAGEGEGKAGGPGKPGIELFRRVAGAEGTFWEQQALGPQGSLGALFATAELNGSTIAARTLGQALTVTPAGAWVDATVTTGTEETPATFYYDFARKEVTASWCDVAAPAGLCTHPEAVELPVGEGRSFAWPPIAGQPYGQRVVTGIGQGAMLSLNGESFERVPIGAGAGAALGAALASPEEGWLGAATPLRLTRDPALSSLSAWPVPFRRPLLAVAPEPGQPVGALTSEALAVGANGEVARYEPGLGWEPESLLTSSGKRATVNLRAVAWPEAGRAYAVGDANAMWVWQEATGLWSPDPGAPQNLINANFTGIAFDPGKPSRGYAVGKQGVLLSYGRSWTQEALPAGVPTEANFTSVAFAGEEAIATWKYPVFNEKANFTAYEGGVIVNEGSGWRVEEGTKEALGGAVPELVSGLADGGAAIATEGISSASEEALIVRQGPTAPWEATGGATLGFPVSLVALNEGGRVRALISVVPYDEATSHSQKGIDAEQAQVPAVEGEPPLGIGPYELPGAGEVLRQTASGWRDEEHSNFPAPIEVPGQEAYDLPAHPDPVLGLLVNEAGTEGWGVGGETGTLINSSVSESVQTAGVFRYGVAAASPTNASASPIPTTAGAATFAIGGNAQCAGACADLEGTGIGPDRWLPAAVQTASSVGAGVSPARAFLYTGSGVAPAISSNGTGSIVGRIGAAAFSREEGSYARRLAAGAGALPVFAAASETDQNGTETPTSSFTGAFSGYQQPLGAGTPAPGIAPVSDTAPGKAYYSFLSSGSSGGPVDVIVLDYSERTLGNTQTCWLAEQLQVAGGQGTPAIVVGQRDIGGVSETNAAEDGAAVVSLLVTGRAPGCPEAGGAGASAYFFDFPEEDRQYTLSAAGGSIPAYGSGTLGYVKPPLRGVTDFVGASGFLLASVETAKRNPTTNVAPVSARLIPAIGQLAIYAADGTLLRRSHQALFEGLARRPQAGSECSGSSAPTTCDRVSPDPYIPIPDECVGANCATGIFPEYSFTSSNPEVAQFVAHDPASTNPRNVELVDEKPVADASSGLLCAFNAGTTTVTVAAGGLAYSTNVTVQAGSVQRPCGTTPLAKRATSAAKAPPFETPGAPPTTQPEAGPSPIPPPPPPPAPVPPPPIPVVTPVIPHVPQPAPPTPPVPPAPFVVNPQTAPPLVPIVPPPTPPAFQPTPPTGTAPISATEHEEEDEEAYDLVSQMSAHQHPARRAPAVLHPIGGSHLPPVLPALAILAALGAGTVGAAARRRSRRGGRTPAFERITPNRR